MNRFHGTWAVRTLFWTYVLGWTAMLLVPDPLSLLGLNRVVPDSLDSGDMPWDKFVHALGYVLTGALAGLSYGGAASWGRWLFLWAISAAHGALTELAQMGIEERTGSVRDWAADAVGAAIGLLLVLLLRNVGRRSSQV